MTVCATIFARLSLRGKILYIMSRQEGKKHIVVKDGYSVKRKYIWDKKSNTYTLHI